MGHLPFKCWQLFLGGIVANYSWQLFLANYYLSNVANYSWEV